MRLMPRLRTSNAAAAVASALPLGHVEEVDAATVAADALSLHTQLLAIQLDAGFVAGNPSAPFLAAIAAAATLADDNVAPAQSLTDDLTALVGLGDVATTLAALNIANGELAAAQPCPSTSRPQRCPICPPWQRPMRCTALHP